MHKEHGTSRESKPVRIGDLRMGLISRLHRMGCSQNNSASSVSLHTSSLSPNSFFLSLTSTSTRNPLWPFRTLLDSGLSHSFVNEAFAVDNKLKFSHLLNPILLRMFDGSTPSNVSKKVWMLITFSTG